MKYALTGVVVAALTLGGLNSADAALMKTTFDGTVTLDNSGVNPFGLMVGDTVSGMATWDDTLVTGTSANEGININGLAGWDFSITLGSFTFGQSDVTDPTYTEFFFDLGSFDGIQFFIEPIDIAAFTNLLIEDFDGGRSIFVEDATLAVRSFWNSTGTSPMQ